MAQYNQLNCSIDDQLDEDSYTEWIIKVEKIVYASIQMYLDDLPDENYRINFDDGMIPEEMAKIIIGPIDKLIGDSVSRLFS